jgi:hypothetical protein
MKKDEVLEHLTKKHYSFAYTMSNHPHWYTVREEWDDHAVFEEVCIYIRTHGTPRKFFKKELIYCVIGDYEYWTMGAPIPETVIINRAYVGPCVDFAVDKSIVERNGMVWDVSGKSPVWQLGPRKVLNETLDMSEVSHVDEAAVMEAAARIRRHYQVKLGIYESIGNETVPESFKLATFMLKALGLLPLNLPQYVAGGVHIAVSYSMRPTFDEACEFIEMIAGKFTAYRRIFPHFVEV